MEINKCDSFYVRYVKRFFDFALTIILFVLFDKFKDTE